jgi:hypothetical protein
MIALQARCVSRDILLVKSAINHVIEMTILIMSCDTETKITYRDGQILASMLVSGGTNKAIIADL